MDTSLFVTREVAERLVRNLRTAIAADPNDDEEWSDAILAQAEMLRDMEQILRENDQNLKSAE